MISIERVDKTRFSIPAGLRVSPEQEKFAGKDVAEYVRSWRDDDLHFCFLIVSPEGPVGFFALDFAGDRHAAYVSDRDGFAVLRCFFIDERHQGKKFAGKALQHLPEYVRREFPALKKIYLTVNEKNPVAQNLYLRAGYTTLPQRYLGGGAGPQLVMVREL
jgi:GNAT superfamily N-acetyltransferase